MAKLVHFLKKKLKGKDSHGGQQEMQTAVPRLDIYLSYLTDDWEDVLTYPLTEKDVLAASESALRQNDIAGALKMMSIVTSHTTTDDDKLEESWARVLSAAITSSSHYPNLVETFAHVERGRREKAVLTFLMKALCDVSSASSPDSDWEKRRNGVKQFALYCSQQGYLSFGFDLALSSGNYDEAYSILESAERKSEDCVWMLLDVACHQVTPSERSVRFIDYCTHSGRTAFAFSLAVGLEQWEKVKERVTARTETMTSLTSALMRAVQCYEWEVTVFLLDLLPVREIREELAGRVPRRNVGVIIDVLLENRQLSEAVRLAASHGMLAKAAEIVASRRYVMDRELSVHVTNACFDFHCEPDHFLPDCCWDRELVKHVLGSPRRKPLSENQWEAVWKLIDTCPCPAEVVTALARRAVQEDASCLRRFIDQGIDDELMDCLLQADPCDGLSDRQLRCVTDLLGREADVVCGVTGENDRTEADELDGGHDGGQGAGQGPSSQECDWSTTIPVLDGVPVSAWYDVMKAAQRAKRSKHLRELTKTAAREGVWNCFICLAVEGLHEHPLDILVRLLHKHPEKLLKFYLQGPEHWLHCEEESCHHGWTDSLRYEPNLLDLHNRGLLEERHRAILLKRALVMEDWNALQSLVLLDLTLAERKAVFAAAMRHRKWSLAMDVFDVLPDSDRVDPQVFQQALKELTPSSSELIALMVERGLYNPYLTPQFFHKAALAGSVHQGDRTKTEKGLRRKHPTKTPSSSKTVPPTPLIGQFWVPNPPVTISGKVTVTSRAGKRVARAAAAGDWVQVMNSYEGGMGGASKDRVLREAMSQDKWSSVVALIRRDPEAHLFYGLNRELENAVDVGAWSAVEAVVDKLATKEDRDWLLPRAVLMHRWSLALKLVKKGVDPELCGQAVQAALAANAWSFVMGFVQLKEVTCPGSLDEETKKEVVKMVARLLTFFKTMGQGQGKGQVSRKDGCPKKSDEDNELMTMEAAEKLHLWKVCQVLLLCGVRPVTVFWDSTLYCATWDALCHNQADVIDALLRLPSAPATPRDVDRLLHGLLLAPDLDLDPERGVRLLRKLLDLGADPFACAFRRASRAILCLQARKGNPSAQQALASQEGGGEPVSGSGPGSEGSTEIPTASDDPGSAQPDTGTEFARWVSDALKEADAATFQPCVMKAVKAAICREDFVPGLGFCAVTFCFPPVQGCPCTRQLKPPPPEVGLGPLRVPLRTQRPRKQCPDVEILDAAWPDPGSGCETN